VLCRLVQSWLLEKQLCTKEVFDTQLEVLKRWWHVEKAAAPPATAAAATSTSAGVVGASGAAAAASSHVAAGAVAATPTHIKVKQEVASGTVWLPALVTSGGSVLTVVCAPP
jgi:hypothetical protein